MTDYCKHSLKKNAVKTLFWTSPAAECSSLASGPVGYLQRAGSLWSVGYAVLLSNCNQGDLFQLDGRPAGSGRSRAVALSHLMPAARLPGMLWQLKVSAISPVTLKLAHPAKRLPGQCDTPFGLVLLCRLHLSDSFDFTWVLRSHLLCPSDFPRFGGRNTGAIFNLLPSEKLARLLPREALLCGCWPDLQESVCSLIDTHCLRSD